MGLDLCLFVKPAPDVVTAWEETYDRTLHILNKSPVCFRIFDLASSLERWECGEFTLHRLAITQFSGETTTSRDLLWSTEDDGPPCCGAAVLAGTARTEEVYDAILTVAAAVETLLGENAFLHGHVTGHSLHRALTRCAAISEGSDLPSVLSVPYAPLCTRGEELLTRLLAAYDDAEGASRRFAALYLGSQTEMYAVLERIAGPASADAVFVHNLGSYASISQLGTQATVRAFFEATGDVERIITLVDRINATRPAFASPLMLLRTLAVAGITVHPAERVPPQPPPGQGRVGQSGQEVETPRNFVLQYLEERQEGMCSSRFVDREELMCSFSGTAHDNREYMEAVLAREERRFRREGT